MTTKRITKASPQLKKVSDAKTKSSKNETEKTAELQNNAISEEKKKKNGPQKTGANLKSKVAPKTEKKIETKKTKTAKPKPAETKKKKPEKAPKKKEKNPEVAPVQHEEPQEIAKKPEKEKEPENAISDTIPEYVSKACLATLFGITGRRIEQLVQDGTIYNVKMDNRVAFNLVDTVREYIRHFSDKASGKDQKETIDELVEKKLRAEIRLKESQGELHELRTAISMGEYIAKEEIQADYTIFFVRFRNFALSLATRVSGMIAGHVDPTESRRIEGDIQKEIESLLSSFISRSITSDMVKTTEKGIKKAGRPRKNGIK